MISEFIEYLQEKYAAKTQSNYLRSLRHLEAHGVTLEDKESFRSWTISQRNRGTRDRTVNVYLKAYNVYLEQELPEEISNLIGGDAPSIERIIGKLRGV